MKNKKEKSNYKENPVNKTESIDIKIDDTENKEMSPDVNNGSISEEAAKITELEKQVQNYKDLYMRTAAEFDNYKKRTDNERADFYNYAGEKVLGEMLPVLDDFDRTMDSFEKSHDKDALKKGIDIVYEKFKNVLLKQGVKEMVSDGKKFDVNLHEAILQQPDPDKEPETILTTVEKGYNYKDKVLRHAKVVVSSKPE